MPYQEYIMHSFIFSHRAKNSQSQVYYTFRCLIYKLLHFVYKTQLIIVTSFIIIYLKILKLYIPKKVPAICLKERYHAPLDYCDFKQYRLKII